MAELFGFKFEKIKPTAPEDRFVQKSPDDGTVEISGGGHFAQVLDVEGRDRNDLDLIKKYRDIGQQPECDSAIEDIVNEAIVSDERDKSVDIVFYYSLFFIYHCDWIRFTSNFFSDLLYFLRVKIS